MAQPGTGTGGFSVGGAAATPNRIAPAPASGGLGPGTGTGGFNLGGSNSTIPRIGATAPSSGGGGLGGFFHSVGKDLGGIGHYIAGQGVKAADLGKQVGTGLYGVGKDVVDPSGYGSLNDSLKQWGALFSHPIKYLNDAQAGKYGAGPARSATGFKGLTVGQYDFTKTAIEHPGRSVAADVLAVMPFAHGLAKGGLALAGKGALLDTPRLINEPGREPVSLYTSHNAARRLVEAGIDKLVNKSLANDRASGLLGHEGPVAKYGKARMGGTVSDYARSAIRYRQAMVAVTRTAARGVEKFSKSIKADVADPQLTVQALLHSLHDNALPEHEAIFHEQQAAKGINPEQNTAWAQAFNDAANLKVVQRMPDGRVAIASEHPLAEPLMRADSALEKLGAYAENQIVVRGLREQSVLTERNGRVNELLQRGEPLRGAPPQALTDARRSFAKAQATHEKNLEGEANYRAGKGQKTLEGHSVPPGPNMTLGGKVVDEATRDNSNPWRNRTVLSGQKLEEAQARVQQLEDRYGYSSPARREAQKTGIQAREQVAEAAHRVYGDAAPAHLAQIEGFARQYARTHDVTPHEFYAKAMQEGGTPEDLLSGALHTVRQSLAPTVQEIARRMYAPNGWDHASEEHFVSDMLKAQNGEHVSPDVQHLFTMTHEFVPGRGYVPMTVWEDANASHSPMASAPGRIVGEATQPLNTHLATGEAMAQGMRRTDVAESVISHVQKLFRYFNTVDTRDLGAKFGGKTRLSSDDTLMRYDRRTEAGVKLPAGRVDNTLKEMLGILENKTNLPAPEEEGLTAGVSAVLQDLVGNLFPGHFSPHTEIALEDGTKTTAGRFEQESGRGAEAPPGYVWVPRQIARLKDLEASVTRGEKTAAGRFADNVNGAVTAATVYYKFGHFFTRYFTNAATNMMQGSAAPWEAARGVLTKRALTPDEVQEALAYSGTHYYEAAPGATGSTVVGRGMQKGLHVPFTDKALRTKEGVAVMSPQFWAHNVDAPFRFNSIAFEVRKAGYDGVEGFRQFLQDVRDYKDLPVDERARVDGVLRRADREAIAYDRLNQTEKKYLTRAIWFYPWIKGSTVWTANAILEHPFKTAVLGNLASQGEQEFHKKFGDEPSFAQGWTGITGGSEPVVTDLNTFNPASTAADLAEIPAHLGNIGGMLNPAYGAAAGTAESLNPYGAHTVSPIIDNIKGLLSSAPEYQIVNSAADHGDQSHRLYPGGHGLNPLYKNWLGELVRSFASPAMARHTNPESGHSLAQRERTGR